MRPEKVEIIRPFGPSMARSKMPQELIDAFNTSADGVIKDKEELKKRDYSANLVGKVQEEFSIPQEVFSKYQS